MAKYKKRKDGRFYTTVNTGKYKDNGRPERICIYARSCRELDSKIIKIKTDVKNCSYVKNEDITVKDYALKWLEIYNAAKAINTRAMYSNIINKHIIPTIGTIKINQLTRSDIQLLINSRLDKERTCEQIRVTINLVLKSALADRLVINNVCQNIVLPQLPRSQKRALTKLERDAIKKSDFNDKQKAYVYLLFYLGIRREEALALTKSDIDLLKKTITINKVLIFDKNNPIIKYSTKSDAGNRILPVPNAIIPFLKDYLYSLDQIYLFTKNNGSLVSKSSYDKFWKGIKEKINIAAGGTSNLSLVSGLTAHIFRHNYCTMLYYSGISTIKAAELMGHANTTMIMNIYAHLDEDKENTYDKINSKIAL